MIVGDLDRDISDTRSVGRPDVARHADDRAVIFVDGSKRLVAHVVDLREEAELPVGQPSLRSEEPAQP
jgi:hypothetical protein